MATEETYIPDAPAYLPKGEQGKWKKAYADAFKKAQADYPEQDNLQRQYALREANRMLRVAEASSYKDAMALPAHQVIQREVVTLPEEGNRPVLRVITVDGKRYQFDAPAADQKPADTK